MHFLIFRLIDKSIYVIVDETRDKAGRAMTAILVGDLGEEMPHCPFLIDLVDVETANNSTIQQAVLAALNRLLGDNFIYNNVRLFITDGAAYCVKAGKGLKELMPNLVHITCVAHGLSRVAERVRLHYPLVNRLIAEVKKIFVKCNSRCKQFAASCQIPLPPEPVLSR